MLFMVIETFERDDVLPAYRRLAERGRGLPDGLSYEGSWVEAGCRRCFQLMRCADLELLQRWVLSWRGAGVRFEIVPVLESAQMQAVMAPHLAETETPGDR